VVLDESRLSVPHPRLVERAFALVPLLDVAPDARDPRTGVTYLTIDDPGVKPTLLAL
jgi:2-amino-4-hydroxy-6-hydroxymethyldihydropteridine diphosphokinase